MHAAGDDVFDEPLEAGVVERVAIAQRRDHGRDDAVILWEVHWMDLRLAWSDQQHDDHGEQRHAGEAAEDQR